MVQMYIMFMYYISCILYSSTKTLHNYMKTLHGNHNFFKKQHNNITTFKTHQQTTTTKSQTPNTGPRPTLDLNSVCKFAELRSHFV